MANKPIKDNNLPTTDLPESWQNYQKISANGTEVGLTEKHGYNYQSKQINASADGVNKINNAFTNLLDKYEINAPNGVAGLDMNRQVLAARLPSASTSQKGIVQLSDSETSTSNTEAATIGALNSLRNSISEVTLRSACDEAEAIALSLQYPSDIIYVAE